VAAHPLWPRPGGKLRQCAGTPAFTRLASRFGTTDLARIIRRIARGVILAIELSDRLERRAARGRDISPSPVRVPSPRKPATPRKRARRAKPQPAAEVFDLPTPEEIAAMVRRRPIGAVIVDICHDLGIMQGNVPPELWQELHDAIIDYGGNFAKYLDRMMDRALGPVPDKHVSPSRRGSIEPQTGSIEGGIETPQPSPPVSPALATGPP
jgi:hypothetical protein